MLIINEVAPYLPSLVSSSAYAKTYFTKDQDTESLIDGFTTYGDCRVLAYQHNWFARNGRGPLWHGITTFNWTSSSTISKENWKKKIIKENTHMLEGCPLLCTKTYFDFKNDY